MENQKKEEKQKKRLLPVICGIVLLLLLIAALLLGLHSCDRDTDTDDETKSTSAPTEPSAAVVLEKINIQSHPTKTEYFPGETLDTTGLTLNAFYSNGTREVITEGFTCDPTTMTETGVHPITVRYLDKETRFYVTVKDTSITGLTIGTLPTKTQYFTGDAIDPAGLTLIATYDNGTEKTITEGFTIAPNQLLSAGTQEVTVSYEGLDVRFTVQVEDAVLESISLKTLPNKTVYFQNDILDTTGLTLTATYNDGSVKTITSGFTCTPTKLSTAGTQKITIQYGGKTTSFNVTVTAVQLTGISIATPPNKTTYLMGDILDLTGLTLTATYNNGSMETITSGFTCTPTKLSTAGTQKITVQSEGKSTSFNVIVKNPEVTGISISTMPSKTTYNLNDTLNTASLSIAVSWSNGSKTTIQGSDSKLTISPKKLTTVGTQTIQVTYSGHKTSFKVQVKDPIIGSGTCGDNLTWELTGTGILTIRGTGAMYDYSSGNIAPWRFKSGFLSSGEIKQINLPNGLTRIGEDAFYFCWGYETVTIPGAVTSIGRYAFAESRTLKEISIPDKVTYLETDVFRGCSNLTIVRIGKGVKSIDDETFARCGSLEQVFVSTQNPYFTHSSGVLFTKDMKKLIIFPRTITGKYVMPNTVECIATYAFQACNLTELTLSKNLKQIDYGAFLSCKTLTTVTIPASVTKIDSRAFDGCEALTKIYIMNSNCFISNNDNTLGVIGTTTIYGYAGSTAEAYCQKYGYTFIAI